MADIVNLRMARKSRKRAEDADQAAANRAKSGRTKGEKALQSAEQQRASQILDNARREED